MMTDQHEPAAAAYELATAMWEECLAEGQSARIIVDDAEADDVRALLRTLSHGGRVRVRTARMDDTVVVAAVDATIWDDDAATMRRKLLPPERRSAG